MSECNPPPADTPAVLRSYAEQLPTVLSVPNLRAKLREAADEIGALLAAGERDRQQIARLTAEVERLLDCRGATNGTVSKRGGEPAVCRECDWPARAVLAGEEDARP